MKKKNKNGNIFFAQNLLKKKICLFACFVLTASFACGQSSFFDSVQNGLRTYHNEVLQEKVFVHTDKNFYLTGETIWFKAYVVNAANNREIDISKVVYVELLDNKTKPVMQAMIDNQRASADGSFVLPSSLPTGMYTLRAYTAWMKNFDEAFFFQAPVQIVNTTRRPDWSSLEAKEAYAVQFFPEGGNLVEGLQTKIGFQIQNQYGEGVDGEGVVVKNGSDTVAHFRPAKFGIGSFDFVPEKDAVYKAIVRLNNGEKLAANLPSAYKDGYVLQVQDAAQGAIKVSVAASKNLMETPVSLLVHARSEAKFAATKFIGSGKTEWLIDKSKLGEGVNVFTLFDADRKPVCERLYYKRPTNKLNLVINSDAKEYARRTAVHLKIGSTDKDNLFVPADLSLSVFLLDSLQTLSQPLIEQYLWLRSEVKGHIESPAYYFTTEDAEATTALDNLLLTQGWRRFSWDDIVANKKVSFSFLPEYEGPVIKGKVLSKVSGNALPNVLCYLSSPGEKFFAANAVSNENGDVAFVTKDVYGAVELAVQTSGADSTQRVDLQSSFSDKFSPATEPRFKLLNDWKEQLAGRHVNLQASSSFATQTAQRFQLPVPADSLPFYGLPDARYLLDEYTRFPNMEEVMREITAEVNVNKTKDTFRFSVLNYPYRTHFDSEPLVLLDGVPVFKTTKIIAFDPLKVKRIDVVGRKYFWGNTVNSGIVSYSTYEGNLAGFALDPGVLLMEYNGLQVKREFYSPVYATADQLQSRMPDRRNVLLWAPDVRTNKKGNGEISFYTSDVPGHYAIFLQGLSDTGLAGSKVVTFDVK